MHGFEVVDDVEEGGAEEEEVGFECLATECEGEEGVGGDEGGEEGEGEWCFPGFGGCDIDGGEGGEG